MLENTQRLPSEGDETKEQKTDKMILISEEILKILSKARSSETLAGQTEIITKFETLVNIVQEILEIDSETEITAAAGVEIFRQLIMKHLEGEAHEDIKNEIQKATAFTLASLFCNLKTFGKTDPKELSNQALVKKIALLNHEIETAMGICLTAIRKITNATAQIKISKADEQTECSQSIEDKLREAIADILPPHTDNQT